jgi:hypothetical protein
MNEDVNQPEQASPAEADAANEFAVYESEKPPVPYLPLPSVTPQRLAEQKSQALLVGPRTPSLSSFPKAGEPVPLASGNLIRVLRGMILVLVIGIVCTCLILAYNGHWILFGITTRGTIVNATTLSCSAGKTSYERYAYEVRFTDTTGVTQVANLDGCRSHIGDVAVGHSITILYLPSDPTHIKFKGDLILNCVLMAGVATLLIFLLVWLVQDLIPWERRRRRKQSLSTSYQSE